MMEILKLLVVAIASATTVAITLGLILRGIVHHHDAENNRKAHESNHANHSLV
jgi:hypothetical protein